jgi:Fur family zinc uptake transcriptional regulator
VLELAAPNITAVINQAAAAETFQVEQITLEIAGLCPRCQSDSTDQPMPS